ncbi:type II toxin-antitoxin system prevent-host-death family antitoxin [Metarhizobium album]|uniref:Antitoxin n=1 Tax=Metarhizobium album TaxID=2182425 RepID=A0A2U2DMM1_9HYPH|nr:type II toxin-antitoxin system Phd/YefM family antitoxin [Rhizobium album]OJT99592.1 MAG: prevent-host-death protein [Rhizobium sp. 63-7]PWE54541.1 type II toxin-antitoxin system prevent-host-death family antitoxin [Rhizobium album]
MREIQLKDVKARLSSIVDEAMQGVGTIVTRHGRKEAVIISFSEYERLAKVPSFGWLLAHSPLGEDDEAPGKDGGA